MRTFRQGCPTDAIRGKWPRIGHPGGPGGSLAVGLLCKRTRHARPAARAMATKSKRIARGTMAKSDRPDFSTPAKRWKM